MFFVFNTVVLFSDRLRGWTIAKGIMPFTDLLEDLDRGFEPRNRDSMWIALIIWMLLGTIWALIILLVWPILPFVVILVYSANRKFIRK